MTAPVLVSYTTRSGSTGEVAEAVGAALQSENLEPEVLPMHAVESLTGRSFLILGAPLYVGRLPREFHQFMARHREVLQRLRPWIFILGPTRNIPADFEMARRQAARQLERYDWLQAAEVHVLGGRFDVRRMPAPLSLLHRLPLPALRKIPMTDIRDWVEIRAWARSVALQIKAAA